jgi:DNA-binding beta-propeller fold protein YncE
VALVLNTDGSRLYVANLASDAIAVFDTGKLTAKSARKGMVEPMGFVPTEWMPISMAFLPSPTGGKLYVATDKGKGTGPNNFAQRQTESSKSNRIYRSFTYIATLLYGSLATLDAAEVEKNLAQLTEATLDSNRMKVAD